MIFFGAGASACFGIPTTPDLTEEITNILEKNDQDLLKDIKNFLTGSNRAYNFENILTVLTVLTNPSEVARYHYSHSFVSSYPDYRKDYSDIIDEIFSIICERCTSPFNNINDKYLKPDELESIFQITYDSLIGYQQMYRDYEQIFTTNYDPSLEIWCQKRFLKCMDGFTESNNPEIKVSMENKQFLQSLKLQPNVIHLIRLHGSVWTYDAGSNKVIKFTKPRDRLQFVDSYEHILKKTPILIFPGQESRLRRGEWDQLYQYFRQQLQGNCLFIGYSFRHDVINEPIEDNLANGRITNLGILAPDPDENIANLFQGRPFPANKIIKMPAKFGELTAIRELSQKWFPITVQKPHRSGQNVKNQALTWKNKIEDQYLK